MELAKVRVDRPVPDRVRLVGEVVYDDRPGQVEEYWFDVAEEQAPYLSRTGNPWLVCLAPFAATIGERLRLALPVDRLLYRNVREAVAIWRSWYPELHPVEVIAETIDGLPGTAGTRTGAFFSGGVDSSFTAVRSTEAGETPIDDLVTIGGFDIPLSNLPAFERRRERMAAEAAELGKSLVDVVTNLRATRLEGAGWARLWYACGLASVGLALEGRYRRLMIASTYDYPNLRPVGSHPLTDSLLSSSGTQVLHDGATHDRCAKIEYLTRSSVALRNLQVCFRTGSDRNCGVCEKCFRTMAALDILGKLPEASSFPTEQFDPRRLSRAFLSTPGHESLYRALRSLSVKHGRPDLSRAANRAMRRSRWIRRSLRLPGWLEGKRGLWRAASPIRRALLAGEMV